MTMTRTRSQTITGSVLRNLCKCCQTLKAILQEAQDSKSQGFILLFCKVNWVTTAQAQLHTLILPSRKRWQNSVIFSAVSSSDSGLYLVISSSRVISRTAGHSSFFRPKNSRIRWLSVWSLSMKINRILGEKRHIQTESRHMLTPLKQLCTP